jgi:hypothetical protein
MSSWLYPASSECRTGRIVYMTVCPPHSARRCCWLGWRGNILQKIEAMSESPPTLVRTRLSKSRALCKWGLVLLAVFIVCSVHWLLVQGEERVPGVITRPLGPCHVEWFERRDGAIIIACPHTDLIKLWSLQSQQPWWEHLPVPGVRKRYTQQTPNL